MTAKSGYWFSTHLSFVVQQRTTRVKKIMRIAAAVGILFVLALATALVLTAIPEPPIGAPRDIYNFAALAKLPAPTGVPDLRRYPARDGEQLAYRIYDSTSDRILIFIHARPIRAAAITRSLRF